MASKKKQKRIKQKTHKAAAKRMKLTANGKLKRMKAGRGHLMSHKSGNRVRSLRKAAFVHSTIAATYRKMLGG
ncbi:MAG: 50S ribosomal protein L35 [Planctomycetota bacterium]